MDEEIYDDTDAVEPATNQQSITNIRARFEAKGGIGIMSVKRPSVPNKVQDNNNERKPPRNKPPPTSPRKDSAGHQIAINAADLVKTKGQMKMVENKRASQLAIPSVFKQDDNQTSKETHKPRYPNKPIPLPKTKPKPPSVSSIEDKGLAPRDNDKIHKTGSKPHVSDLPPRAPSPPRPDVAPPLPKGPIPKISTPAPPLPDTKESIAPLASSVSTISQLVAHRDVPGGDSTPLVAMKTTPPPLHRGAPPPIDNDTSPPPVPRSLRPKPPAPTESENESKAKESDESGSGSVSGDIEMTVVQNGVTYTLNCLPPLSTVGDPPPKPHQPSNVKLPRPNVAVTKKVTMKRRRLPSLPPDGIGPPPVPPLSQKRSPSLPAPPKRDIPKPPVEADPSLEPEIYDDIGVESDEVLTHRPTRAVSIIAPMDSDEEEPEEYDDTTDLKHNTDNFEPETYDDLDEPPNNEELAAIDEDIYEEFGDEDIVTPDDDMKNKEKQTEQNKKEEKERKEREARERKEQEKKDKEERKRKEKEDKERLKKSKEDEKEAKRKEEEKKKEMARFKMTGTETEIKAVEVKEDVTKGGKYDLVVKQGDTLCILRTDDKVNPAGRWLARTQQGRVGYVEIKKVEELNTSSNFIEEEYYNDTGEPEEEYCDVTENGTDEDFYDDAM